MKQKIYYAKDKFNEVSVKLGRNLIGNVVLYVTDKQGNKKAIFCFDTCGTLSFPSFKKGENRDLGFKLDRKGKIKIEGDLE